MDTTETKIRQEYEELQRQMSDASLAGTPEGAKLAKRQAELAPLIALYDQQRQIQQDLAALNDPEMAELVAVELPLLEQKLAEIQGRLQVALVPKDPNDEKNVIMELRAGAGGDESSLFAAELYRMYVRYSETRRWKTEILSESPNDVGGYKEIIFAIKGDGAYSQLKYESGVHRVQRVPATESQGRVHTSTVTVAVLPEAEESELEINEGDLRVDVFRSGGHGGQSVNTTDSAVRITHLPTGLVVTCQDEKSQLKNKQKAMGVLRSRLLAQKLEEEQKANREARLNQIGTGDRSEKIRTYNFPQDRVTDHRISRSQRGLTQYMAGNIDDMIEALQQEDAIRKLESAAP
ncbi:MAG TPA: peptide chain release factor 1 [Candidatus Dormibacteraeota bacterium]|nr:peptide chain release factor 1 [Candidatus Dormibacteraeota bacterium]